MNSGVPYIYHACFEMAKYESDSTQFFKDEHITIAYRYQFIKYVIVLFDTLESIDSLNCIFTQYKYYSSYFQLIS